MSGNFAIKGGGVGPLMANAILNFHFDFLNPSLIIIIYTIIAIAPTPSQCRKRLLNSRIATSVNVNLVHAPKEAGNFGESR